MSLLHHLFCFDASYIALRHNLRFKSSDNGRVILLAPIIATFGFGVSTFGNIFLNNIGAKIQVITMRLK